MDRVEIDGITYEHVSYGTLPWPEMAAFENARAVAAEHDTAVKTVKDLTELTKRIKRRPAAAAAGVRVRGSVQRAGAISVLRGIRSGVLAGDWFRLEWIEGEKATDEQKSSRPRQRLVDPDKGLEMRGSDVCERVGKVFGVKLTADDWKNASRADRSSKTLFVGLHAELQALGVRAQNAPRKSE